MQKSLFSRVTVFAFIWLLLGVAYAQEPSPDPAGQDLILDSDGEGIEGTVDSADDLVQAATTVDKDIILVLDNSGSMKQNDPNFLTSQAVSEFINALDSSTRVAIIIFDQNVNLAVPFTEVSAESREMILQSLDMINYRGQFTDSPNAVERAIYELKNNGREEAKKIIIFMTDGIVDTGDTAADQEKSKWLKDSLAPDAAEVGISIIAIAFTEAADFQLIQSLAQTTGGEYYRAIQAVDVQRVFAQINTLINRIEEAVAEPPPQVSQPPMTPQAPIVITVPAQPSPTAGREEQMRTIGTIAAGVAAIVSLAIILWVLLRGRRSGGPTAVLAVTEAYLQDIHGFTSQASYKLSGKPTMLGRVAGKENDQLDYIVIPESTIGRRHSLIDYKDFSYWIVDQGSINGTFVNDTPVTSEVRLKHGDKVRLHKFEFEFVMPEMVDAGMTVMSHTVMANKPAPVARQVDVEATRLKSSGQEQDTGFTRNAEGELDLDFDLTAGIGGDADAEPGGEAITVIRADTPPPADEMDFDLVDMTDMPAGSTDTPASAQKPKVSDFEPGDETLMPGEFDFPDDDATIRKEDGELSLDNFIDLDNLNDKKKK